MDRPYSELGVMPWSGMGMVEWNAVTFMQGEYAYEVYAEHGRGPEGATTGSLTVSRTGKVIAELSCDEGSVSEDFGGFIARVEEAGDHE